MTIEKVSSIAEYSWRSLTQKQLDDAYTQEVYAPNKKLVLQRMASDSARTRSRMAEPIHCNYGSSVYEKLDWYQSESRPKESNNRPVFVFLHGGAWKAGAAKDYAFIAENFVKNGIDCVIPDFINTLQTAGSLGPMVEQVLGSILWVYQNADNFGVDRKRIYLCGHSSGAHLAGVAVTTNWFSWCGIEENIINAALLVSGIYDLEPVRASVRSEYLQITDKELQEYSPINNLHNLGSPLLIAYGSEETPEFIRQAQEFNKSVEIIKGNTGLLVAKNYNHFEIIETLSNPYGLLGSAALSQIL